MSCHRVLHHALPDDESYFCVELLAHPLCFPADAPVAAERSFLVEVRAARKAALGAHIESLEKCLQTLS